MDWIFTLTMLAVLGVTIIPLYFFEANLRKPKKNIMLGVTVPQAHQKSEAVQQITDNYLKQLRIVSAIFALLGLSIFVIPFMSIQITIILTLLLGVILGTALVYIRANRELMALKRRSGWKKAGKPVLLADLRAMEETERPLPRIMFAIPCIIAAIPLIPIVMQFIQGTQDWTEIMLYAITVIWIPLLLIMAEAFRRQNAEVVGAISDFNVITSRIRRRAYMHLMVLTIWLLAIMSLGIWFLPLLLAQTQLLLAITIGMLSIVIMIYAIRAEFAVRRAQEKFTQLAGDTLETDTDEYWIWGMFYYNRNDKRLFINDRVGMNMQMNLAKPVGMISMGLAALVLLAMPFIGVWIMAQEFSPITYSVEGNVVTVTHLTTRHIDLGENFETEVLDTIPSGMRTGGTAVGTFRQGTFQLNSIGTTWVLYHTDNLPLILITTSDGARYLFNYDPVFTPLTQ